uniref:PDZ domain-containing protein n=1 Tax=Bicosoecida sp. CB-2014 TaxID=1486930 RepID=A0A7S1G4M2_9STRA
MARAVALLAAAAAALLAVGAASNSTPVWPQPGGNPQRTSHFTETVASSGGAEAWRYSPGPLVSMPDGAAVGAKRSDGTWPVYAGSPTGLYAIAAPGASSSGASGAAAGITRTLFGTPKASVIWSHPQTSVATPVSLSPDGTRLYFGGGDNKVYAVDTADGTTKWAYQTGSALNAAPTVSSDGKTIYLGSSVGTFFALNTADGKPAWICAALGPVDGGAALSADESTVFFGSSDTYLYAVKAHNNTCGSDSKNTNPCRDAPAPGGGTKTGCGIWWLRPNQELLLTTPLVDVKNDRVIVSTDNSAGIAGVYAVPTSGQGNITTLYSGPNSINTSPVLVSDDVVAFASEDNKVYAVNMTTLKVMWTHDTAQPLSAAPISNGEVVVIAGRTGVLTVVKADTGALGWEGNVGGTLQSAPAVDGDGRIIVTTTNGIIAAYSAASGSLSTEWAVIFGAICLLGLFEGVVGYRYFPITVAIIGAGLLAPAGYIIGAYVDVINSHEWYHLGVTAGAGLIGAILFATILRKIGAFALGLGFGAILAVDLAVVFPVVPQLQVGSHIDFDAMAIPLSVIGGGGLVFGIASCVMPKLVSIFATSLFGATTLVDGVAYYANITDTMYLGIGYAAVFFVFVVIQACCTGRGDHHLTESQRKALADSDDEEGEYRRMRDDDPERGTKRRGGARGGRDGEFDPDFEPLVGPDGSPARGSASSRLYSSREGADYGSRAARAAPPIDDDGTGRTFTVTFNKGPLGLRFAPGGGRIPAYVMGVSDGQGRRNGVSEGDILVAIAGNEVNAFQDFDSIMGELSTARRPVALTFRSRSRGAGPRAEVQLTED